IVSGKVVLYRRDELGQTKDSRTGAGWNTTGAEAPSFAVGCRGAEAPLFHAASAVKAPLPTLRSSLGQASSIARRTAVGGCPHTPLLLWLRVGILRLQNSLAFARLFLRSG